MTVDLQEFNKLKSQVERLQRTADKAQGALEQAMEILKEEFGCDSVEEAKDLAEKYRKEARVLKEKFEEAETEFTEKWGEVLNEP